jgi:hypothetical protein
MGKSGLISLEKIRSLYLALDWLIYWVKGIVGEYQLLEILFRYKLRG